MQTTEFIWLNGKRVPWQEANVHVLTHTLHYGGGAFEGIRFYETARGPAIFRLKEHIDRLFYSASTIKMEIPFSREEVIAATKDIVKSNKLLSGYIRPIAYYGYGVMGVDPTGAPVELAIACWPWGAYLAHDLVNIKTSRYVRIHPDSTVADAKLCGHYINSMMARLEMKGTEYDEALLLDSKGFVAEGSGENFFLIKNGKLLTPPKGNILPGITRATVMELANDFGYKVEERELLLEDVYNGDEAFFTGTAAEITPIRSVDQRLLNGGELGPITQTIRDEYHRVVRGQNPKYDHYLTYLEN